jgi:hypothetical protein
MCEVTLMLQDSLYVERVGWWLFDWCVYRYCDMLLA